MKNCFNKQSFANFKLAPNVSTMCPNTRPPCGQYKQPANGMDSRRQDPACRARALWSAGTTRDSLKALN